MGVLFMVVGGAVLGWLTAIVLQIESPRGVMLNMMSGVGGALLAGLVIVPLLGNVSMVGGDYRVGSLVLTLIGSLAVVTALNLLHRPQQP